MPAEEPPQTEGAPLVVCDVARVHVALPEPFARIELVSRQAEHPGRLSLPVSVEQGRAVALALARRRAPRPFTHELASEIAHAVGASVLRATLHGSPEGGESTFAATLELMGADGCRHPIDARPSDAIVLCLLEAVPAPILVEAPLLAGPPTDG
ncbi:protein of unknown function DUF151 [Acidimicrobium ferrooxidans DSM 10331]|uniref:BFN domain-containing protein n=1 Tax=Acidimicrobium ferrooxidans (strain DSM 10331 / JCM 15462 / NBRC 103882 / ICP) TaxID=525909 RepID=C7LYT8_ACIFD|nr:bifunctional nuclease domain-containing protein [Acidimicrobium ferrooxidans]ACU53896.1 protein of unknown function DUF151 [Acidimicrobium ferrooxidans DSM 10331]